MTYDGTLRCVYVRILAGTPAVVTREITMSDDDCGPNSNAADTRVDTEERDAGSRAGTRAIDRADARRCDIHTTTRVPILFLLYYHRIVNIIYR